MLIDEKHTPQLEQEKEVKVKIPVGYHIKLHSMKVLTGKQISTTVTEALTQYFEALQEARKGNRQEERPDHRAT